MAHFVNSKKRLICYYGDDFTGSTDAMEALAINGVKTVLFLKNPEPSLIKSRFSDIQGFGIAGESRTMSPEEMSKKLPSVFEQLRSMDAPIIHYKTCSTFDSSPYIGSIGKVLDLGKKFFKQQTVPILVGAPALKRYTVFGNHFATVGDETYRLDRHPTMSKHPVTPMNESDLRFHLAKQTNSDIALLSVLDLEKNNDLVLKKYQAMLKDQPDAILYDVLNDEHLEKNGSLLWENAKEQTLFAIGSSGVEYALTKHWKKIGLIEPNQNELRVPSEEQILVISGSCSPVTQSQIENAEKSGFQTLRINTKGLLDSDRYDNVRHEIFEKACEILNNGQSLIIYTALGPDDPSINENKEYAKSKGINPLKIGEQVGQQLGQLTREILSATRLKRIIIAGGDTSSYAMKELDIYALELASPIAPGSPLCRSYSEQRAFDGIELALKGGQMGQHDYFNRVLKGKLD